ncbi:MAG: S-layer family protein [Symplocastrum torsivum CPER-KK1]|jgi:filamentous hemagglutinin family protein|uniref:S-layer family protein n=1 Tax=Symplocastrum torsivum CPER-KK1 TaxID=450513 RepID=A0A951UCI9_9CYAN|nr:S-layer family protein [Symplocastrum torsivum CPER-KK1]
MNILSKLQRYWKLSVLSSFVLGEAITLTLHFDSNFAWGQVTSDNSLGSESSLITSPTPGTFQIEGGATRGTNLFHSFSEFSVPTLGIAYFNNTSEIQNIFSRVTGGSVSNINGLIRANGVNLFLLNPNGIIFGSNASLDIGGSFMGSTASSLSFADGSQFSATAPKTTPLLSVNVPFGLQYGGNAGSIQVQSSTLQVPDGETLALVGGDVLLNGTSLQAAGGRVELGGVAGTGVVGLSISANDLRLSFPDALVLSNVSLSNEAGVFVLAGGGGSIAINAQNLNMAEGSELLAGIAAGLGSSDSIAGDIEINTTGAINLTDESYIYNLVLVGAVGKGGDINITTGQLLISDGTQVAVGTSGSGDGGNLIVNASDSVQVIGTTLDGQFPSALGALTLGTGRAGNAEIRTRQLLISGGAQVGAGTFGSGNGGNLIVNASDSVQVIGTSTDGRASSGLYTQTEPGSTGMAGNLEITTGQLLLLDGAQVSASTLGSGNGGNLIVNASDSVQVIGTSANGIPSGLFNDTPGKGNAGNVEITTRQLLVFDGAYVDTKTLRSGNGGDLIINASDSVQVIGTSANGFPSLLITSTYGTGAAGNLVITTGRLLVLEGTQISASTFGSGDGGSLIVNAWDLVKLAGISSDGQASSSLNAGTTGTGTGGNLEIITGQLLVLDGSQVDVSTLGKGNGGNLIINASEGVQVIGTTPDGQFPSGLFALTTPRSTGNGGNINISTNNLDLSNGAVISSQSEGSGKAGGITIHALHALNLNNGEISATANLSDAGNINVEAPSIRLDNGASINANTFGGQGNINLNSADLVLRHGSNITTNAQGSSVIGGNITIDTGVLAALENSDISANSANFRGGNVTVTAQGIFGTEFREQLTPLSDITATGANSSLNGTVTINTPDVDPSQGLVNLPDEPANVEVAEGCQSAEEQVAIEFFNTGRGGLAPSPYEPLSSTEIWEDVPRSTQEAENLAAPTSASVPATRTDKIVEAQGWLINETGKVVLVAEVPATRSQHRCRLH